MLLDSAEASILVLCLVNDADKFIDRTSSMTWISSLTVGDRQRLSIQT